MYTRYEQLDNQRLAEKGDYNAHTHKRHDPDRFSEPTPRYAAPTVKSPVSAKTTETARLDIEKATAQIDAFLIPLIMPKK